MKQDDRIVLEKMIGYCDDVAALLEEYGSSFEEYQNRIVYNSVAKNKRRRTTQTEKVKGL